MECANNTVNQYFFFFFVGLGLSPSSLSHMNDLAQYSEKLCEVDKQSSVKTVLATLEANSLIPNI